MSSPSPLPPTQVFERLQITDGLLMTAERWRSAHNYHRQRQNFHYQILNQPGIVYGLGVSVIEAPQEVAAQYRDQRWVQIHPGIAIDGLGNPIIVSQPETFRLQSDLSAGQTLLIYLTLSYVDPDQLNPASDRDTVQEAFRIDEKTQPSDLDVELCRILLQGERIQLVPLIGAGTGDVFAPGINQLDLCYRQVAQARPRAQVSLAHIKPSWDEAIAAQLSELLRSVAVLYPALQGNPQVLEIDPADTDTHTLLSPEGDAAPELVYLSREQLLALESPLVDRLRQYLTAGGTLLVTVDFDAVNLLDLFAVQRELTTALANLGDDEDLTSLRRDLEAELAEIQRDIDQRFRSVPNSIQGFASALDNPLTGDGTVGHDHPLRREPFLFAQFPQVDGYPLQLWQWHGMILMVGNLAPYWGLDEALSHSREEIRSAQELGINLLHFAWRRRQLIQLQQPVQLPVDPSLSQTPSQNLYDRVSE